MKISRIRHTKSKKYGRAGNWTRVSSTSQVSLTYSNLTKLRLRPVEPERCRTPIERLTFPAHYIKYIICLRIVVVYAIKNGKIVAVAVNCEAFYVIILAAIRQS